MSQRECAGFNAPRFSVEAGEPERRTSFLRPKPVVPPRGPLSEFRGVAQPANRTAISFSGRALRFIVSSLAWPFFQSRADGVAQPASCASVVSEC
jgi:hypothetical protein